MIEIDGLGLVLDAIEQAAGDRFGVELACWKCMGEKTPDPDCKCCDGLGTQLSSGGEKLIRGLLLIERLQKRIAVRRARGVL